MDRTWSLRTMGQTDESRIRKRPAGTRRLSGVSDVDQDSSKIVPTFNPQRRRTIAARKVQSPALQLGTEHKARQMNVGTSVDENSTRRRSSKVTGRRPECRSFITSLRLSSGSRGADGIPPVRGHLGICQVHPHGRGGKAPRPSRAAHLGIWEHSAWRDQRDCLGTEWGGLGLTSDDLQRTMMGREMGSQCCATMTRISYAGRLSRARRGGKASVETQGWTRKPPSGSNVLRLGHLN